MSLSRRLLVAQALVIATMAVTVMVVAAAVGPITFDLHMARAGRAEGTALQHAETAFKSAGLVSLAVGVAVAALGAVAVSILLTRRVHASLAALADGAERIAREGHAAPIALPLSTRELDGVARALNSMATQIDSTERTRRRLLTDLSHELRTPLSVIDVVLEGLEDDVVAPDHTMVATLRAQSIRLARLAKDIREVSAAEEHRLDLHPVPVAVGHLLAGAIASATPECSARGLRLEVDDPAAPVLLDADPNRMGQVLDNLLRNAIQHTPWGRIIHVWTDSRPPGVRIGVRDEGEGITETDLPHIFERFYRGSSRRYGEGTGTGVGLAISRAIVRAHSGELTATSPGAGRGAEFVISMPVRTTREGPTGP